VKRLLDLICALAALVLLSPVILATALAVRFNMGEPAFYRQMRPGLGGVPFTLYKLRTMRPPAPDEPPEGGPLSDEFRATRLGRFLRKTSLDELPQLWNVVRGDMSLVGPRPLLMEYLPLYTKEQARRHDVRPGITGWAQVHGRNALPGPERLALDVWYVDHRTLALDLWILALTVKHIALPDGIYAAEGTTTFGSRSRLATASQKETT